MTGTMGWINLFDFHKKTLIYFLELAVQSIMAQKFPVIVSTEENLTLNDTKHRYCNEKDCSKTNLNTPSWYREEIWTVPLIAISSVNIFVIGFFEAFMLWKAEGSISSRRHLILDQVLLFGLILCSLLGYVFAADPSWFTCGVIRLGLGLTYSLVFGTLLVKTIFLHSLHTGVYLPALYQVLLLFFVVVVQLSIGIQWLMQRPPIVIVYDAGGTSCNSNVVNMLLVLVYNIFLIAFVVFLAIKTKENPENYQESRFIGIATGLTIPLWLVWILIALIIEPPHHDAAMGFGVVLNATVIFLIVFVPKGFQMTALGEEWPNMEEKGVLASPAPSYCSPSFLHIKPPVMTWSQKVKPLNEDILRNNPPPSPLPVGRVWNYKQPTYHSFFSPPEEVYFYPNERETNFRLFSGSIY
ncbi:metabotropic glutamate receptor 2-like isoform X2 [Tachypleus tridentatus]|uniref:metabotropic glutamate receptor 2-like isoform X2 n=1 Tax=Tachypleus tridentatus TaxID=6853 RepID=UPI003FCF7913